ncbi:hypothetical protein HX878_21005 [Pseudomonas veronii]|uniref:hypothetical protein n=1 Tax=Pseudomonas veronii TaxID=76761 RepID=UPI0015A0FEDD|nr:hypothetical protein [Pseudomonas veronii]NWD57211.1 hypothetical protein [Pseudomonas veronii]
MTKGQGYKSGARSGGFRPCNDLVDAAANQVMDDPYGAVHVPWMAGRVGAESKTLLLLAQRYGALGLAVKGDGGSRKFKFYYSRATTGSWFTEVWPLWKVAAWFVVMAFFAFGFYAEKSGAGCFLVGVGALVAFGPRSVAALRNSVVAGRLSGYAFARESFPMILAGAVTGVVMLEWAYVLPWNAGKLNTAVSGIAGILALEFGVEGLVSRAVKAVITGFGFACGSVLIYQVVAGGMVKGWLDAAFRDGLVFVEPEPGTWFHKLRTTGYNAASGYFMTGFLVLAACGLALPLLQ